MTRTTLEWLEADGLGGFASHTRDNTRTRRYHGLLLVAKKPPAERRVLVNGVDVVLDLGGERLALTSQTYKPTVEGEAPIVRHEGRPVHASFDGAGFPTWTYDLGAGTTLEHTIFVPRGSSLVILRWRLNSPAQGTAQLIVRPFLSGRDYHSLHRENTDFDFAPAVDEVSGRLVFRPYQSEPAVTAVSNGLFESEPYWYREFLYTADRDRGLDCVEDLGAPGTFSFDLAQGEALLVFGTGDAVQNLDVATLEEKVAAIEAVERLRRGEAGSALERAASAYVVERGSGKTILAGYPWFTD